MPKATENLYNSSVWSEKYLYGIYESNHKRYNIFHNIAALSELKYSTAHKCYGL